MARAIDADKKKKELAPYEENDFSQQMDVILKIVDMQPTLAAYENTGLEPCDYSTMAHALEQAERAREDLAEIIRQIGATGLDRLRVLMEADRDGLVRIARRPPLENECCGNCGHFQRITGTARGDCAVREYTKNHWGQEDRKRGKFTPSQSRKACRQFQRRTDDDGRSDPEG